VRSSLNQFDEQTEAVPRNDKGETSSFDGMVEVFHVEDDATKAVADW